MQRFRQFRQALRAVVEPAEVQQVLPLLSAAEQRLFLTLSPAGMRHALNVCRTLQEAGERDGCLMVAALLHDCGKRDRHGRPLALHWYVLGSQLERRPRLYAALARLLPLLGVYRDHAELGAALLRAAGSAPCVIDLVANHHRPSSDRRLLRLKWADQQH